MDIISHGLWGGIAFGRGSVRSYWTAFFFGVMPDLFSFGLFTIATFLGLSSRVSWGDGEPPPMEAIPQYVHGLYNVTHSLIIFVLVFALVWILREKRPYWLMAGWGLHILVDVPTHSYQFFPTPFLWPFSDYRFDGEGWGHPLIFFPNIALLVILYGIFFYWRYKQTKRFFPKL